MDDGGSRVEVEGSRGSGSFRQRIEERNRRSGIFNLGLERWKEVLHKCVMRGKGVSRAGIPQKFHVNFTMCGFQ